MIILIILLIILLFSIYSHINESYIVLTNTKLPNDMKKYQESPKKFKYGCIPRSIYPGLVKVNNEYSKIIRDEFADVNGESIFNDIKLKKNIKFMHIIKNNKPLKIAAKFPKLLEAVKNVRKLKNVSFSLLPANTTRHMHDIHNKDLFRAHIPIKLPNNRDECGICVEKECRTWNYGDFLLLNENLMHQVWNKSETDRIILLIDVQKVDINQP